MNSFLSCEFSLKTQPDTDRVLVLRRERAGRPRRAVSCFTTCQRSYRLGLLSREGVMPFAISYGLTDGTGQSHCNSSCWRFASPLCSRGLTASPIPMQFSSTEPFAVRTYQIISLQSPNFHFHDDSMPPLVFGSQRASAYPTPGDWMKTISLLNGCYFQDPRRVTRNRAA